MSQLYTLTTQGPIPLSVKEAKEHLRITIDADDVYLTTLLEAATEFAEAYTGREYRVNTWTLSIDAFADRIPICKDPLDASAPITSVTRLVSSVATTVASSVYYLKRGAQSSELLLDDGQSWPDDVDNREQAIVITFLTEVHSSLEQVKVGILRHVAYLYENRGDCDLSVSGIVGNSAKLSGAAALYDQHRISRV